MDQSKLKSATPSYSIVIPAYEEAPLIVNTLKTVHDFLKQQKMFESTEVVVVAAKGRDNTAELARGQGQAFSHFQLIEPGPKVGKGRDVKLGLSAAKGHYVLFTDADLATPIAHCRRAFSVLESGGADVVIGVRNLWAAHHSLKRKIVSVGSNWVVRIFLMPLMPDSQCGFKAFNRKALDEILPRLTITGWGFDIELLFIAKSRKIRLQKMFIDDWHDPKLGTGLDSGESALKSAVNTFKELLVIWRQRLKGAYK